MATTEQQQQYNVLWSTTDANPLLPPNNLTVLNKALQTPEKQVVKAINSLKSNSDVLNNNIASITTWANNLIGDTNIHPELKTGLEKIGNSVIEAIINLEKTLNNNTTLALQVQNANSVIEAVNFLNTTITKLNQDMETIKSQAGQVDLSAIESKINLLDTAVDKNSSDINVINNSISTYTSNVNGLTTTVNKHNTDITNLNNQVSTLNTTTRKKTEKLISNDLDDSLLALLQSGGGGEIMIRRVGQDTQLLNGSTSTPALMSVPFDTKNYTELPTMDLFLLVASSVGKSLPVNSSTYSVFNDHKYDEFISTSGFRTYSQDAICATVYDDTKGVYKRSFNNYKEVTKVEVF